MPCRFTHEERDAPTLFKNVDQATCESGNPAGTILDLARTNHVDLIVIGAPTPQRRTFAWWRSVASGVTADAPCSVYVVRVPDNANSQDENA